MKKALNLVFFFFGILITFSQTKVSGYLVDEENRPVAFANVLFKGSTEGTISNEDGLFYLESESTWNTVVISFLGYETQEISLEKKVNYDLRFVLKEEASALNEVVIVTGKQSKKASENPAIAILKKIWERKRKMVCVNLSNINTINMRRLNLTSTPLIAL